MSAALDYPQRHLISAEEYLRMGEVGIFHPEVRLELIEGEIIEMAPIGSPHAATVRILHKLLGDRCGDRALVSGQSPLIVGSRSVPEPDLALLKPRADAYRKAHPTAEDVLLVIEVSDTTLRFDLKTKVPLYARAAIPEVWVVDVNAEVVHVFRQPGPAGFGSSTIVSGASSVACAALPAVKIEARELF